MHEIDMLSGDDLFEGDVPVFLNISEERRGFDGKHSHNFIEIAYVSSGQGTHVVGDEQFKVSKGDIFIINYGTPHVFVADSNDKNMKPIVYNCIFKPEFLDYSLIDSKDFKDIASSLLFNIFFIDNKPAIGLKLNGNQQTEIEEIYRKMQSEYFSKPKGYINILRSCLIEMLTKIFRFLENKDVYHVSNDKGKIEFVGKALEFLKENYHSAELNLNEVAVRTFLSRSYFSRVFKEITGQNFSVYLQNLRVSEACNLLKNTDRKVSEIMCDVGFKDIKNFNVLFKRITGKTPGEYRRS